MISTNYQKTNQTPLLLRVVKSLKKVVLFGLVTLCLMVLSMIHHPNGAIASTVLSGDSLTNYNTNPGWQAAVVDILPSNLYALALLYNNEFACTSASRQTNSPWVTRWVHAAGSPRQTTINATYGQASINLQQSLATVQCWNSVGIHTYNNITSITGTTPAGTVFSIVKPSDTVADVNNALPSTHGRFLWDASGAFTYSPPGGFVTSGTYTITTSSQDWNIFSNGAISCVAPPGASTNGFGTTCPIVNSTFSIFVSVPPPPPGTLKTTKTEVDSNGNATTTQATAVTSSAIRYYYSNTNFFFPTGTESGTTNPVERDRIDTSVNPFGAEVDVPAGYKLLRASTSNPSNTNANATCTGAGQTGTCKVIGIQVATNTTTTVDFFIQRISLTSLGDLSCTTENGKNYFTGWGIDKDAQGTSPTIGIYENGILKQTVSGNVLDPNYNTYLEALGYATNAATQYNIKTEFAELFHDGAEHTVTPRINEKILANITFGGTSSNCSVSKYLWPWLQTTGGNVVANGKINGHPASDTLPGARATANTDKEVEFLIISKVGGAGVPGGGPFCSRKNYILTNAEATGGTNCSNGSGYSVLNVYSLGNDGTDKVVAGVKAAFGALSPECRRITDSVNNIPTNVPAACFDGVIIKYTGTSLAGYELKKGRVTILVEGDLTIGQSVGYGTTAYTDLRDVPNLAIVVNGNVKVLSDTPRVDASIYATGYISTCDTASNVTIVFCGNPLTINGFLSAQSGFTFGRAYINDYNAQAVPPHAPAEIINLTLQSVVYPPPGIDYNSVFSGDSSVKIDSSEYQPRF